MIETGTMISERYEIQERIGSGGMADVYKAVDTRLNRQVAVKVLKSEFSEDTNFIARFKNEARAAAGLSHPNIVNVYDVGDDNGSHYIVMELVEGITLKKFIEKKGRLEVREAVGISIQIAQGMEAAHEHGIIHRDIKPQNIMISRDGKVKVADFGIAKVVSSTTYTQNTIGSVHYLSPEQARGGYYDARSDIYSLGVTLYEMLTGQLPFGGESDVSVAIQHIQGEAKPAREIVPTIPYSLDKVVQKCMQKRPEDRYTTASELIVDLKRSVQNPDGDFVKFNSVADGGTRTFTNAESVAIKQQTASAPSQQYRGEEEYAPQPAPRRSQRVMRDDYDELDTIDSRFEKVVIIITIFAAILLVFGAVMLFLKLFPIGSDAPVTTPTPVVSVNYTPTPVPTQAQFVKVPNVLSLTQEDAERSLYQASADFVILYEDAVYSEQKEGTVIEQYPSEQSDVPGNQTIRLTLSAGGEPVAVPPLVSLTQANAELQLAALGLKAKIVAESSETVPEGKVTRTMPLNGEKVHAGDTVIVYISTGFEYPTNIPDIYNKSEAVARALLSEVNLKMEVTAEEYSNEVPVGYVMTKFKAGATVAEGSTIEVTVSKGPIPNQGIPDSKTYFAASYDTTDMANPCSKFYYSDMWFEIYQVDPETGESYSFVIYTDYDNVAIEKQVVSVNYVTFSDIFRFKIYTEFANDYVDYAKLKEGPASISGFLITEDDFIELGSQDIVLEVYED